jgi:hypothetical protein
VNYIKGQYYMSKCKWGQCGKEFTWVYDGKKPREVCSQRHGLLWIVWYTIDEIQTLTGKKPNLSLDQAADCIELRLKGYCFDEISKLLALSVNDVYAFLSHRSTIIRHRLEDKRSKPMGPVDIKIKKQIQANLKRGDNINSLSRRYGLPRSRVNLISKEDLMSIPGAKDMTDEINALRVELKAETLVSGKACNSRDPEEITLNGKKYREVLD